jgi:hypothetical protein
MLQIQAEFPVSGPGLTGGLAGSASTQPGGASLATLSGGTTAPNYTGDVLTPKISMLDFLGKSSFTPTLYDYIISGVYTWVKPSACKNITGFCVASGGSGGGCYLGTPGIPGTVSDGSGGGAGQAKPFASVVTGNLTLIVGASAYGNYAADGNSGNPSAMSGSGISVSCNGGGPGIAGNEYSSNGVKGGTSGAGYTGGSGSGNDSGDAGGGGGNSGNGYNSTDGVNGSLGGPGSTYTINGINYYCSPGGVGGGWGGAYAGPSYYGAGGNGVAPFFQNIFTGWPSGGGRILFYATT